MVQALSEFLSVVSEPSVGSVIEFDLNTVTVDLAPFPIDEILDFRAQNLAKYKRYMLSVRKFALELSRMPVAEKRVAFDLRQAELDDLANDLRKHSRKAWKKPASFGLTLVGSAISALSSPIASAVRIGAAAAGYEKPTSKDAGSYSYLFNAASRFI